MCERAALRDFARLGAGLTVSSAEAGVVRFGSDAEAARMFARFATQWRSCEGTTGDAVRSPRERRLELDGDRRPRSGGRPGAVGDDLQ